MFIVSFWVVCELLVSLVLTVIRYLLFGACDWSAEPGSAPCVDDFKRRREITEIARWLHKALHKLIFARGSSSETSGNTETEKNPLVQILRGNGNKRTHLMSKRIHSGVADKGL